MWKGDSYKNQLPCILTVCVCVCPKDARGFSLCSVLGASLGRLLGEELFFIGHGFPRLRVSGRVAADGPVLQVPDPRWAGLPATLSGSQQWGASLRWSFQARQGDYRRLSVLNDLL